MVLQKYSNGLLVQLFTRKRAKVKKKCSLRHCTLKIHNDEYNNVETDFKGNPQYSKMISKICSNENRTSMILNVIQHELKDNYEQQIMILAHNKSLIDELFHKTKVFEESVGLYIGGMKEEQLKESETKKIIIATYAMASEGLDIKTLTTFVWLRRKQMFVKVLVEY